MPEYFDGLPDAILVDFKVPLVQIGSKLAFSIAHRGVEHHEIDVYRNMERYGRLGRCIARDTEHRQNSEDVHRDALVVGANAPTTGTGVIGNVVLPCAQPHNRFARPAIPVRTGFVTMLKRSIPLPPDGPRAAPDY